MKRRPRLSRAASLFLGAVLLGTFALSCGGGGGGGGGGMMGNLVPSFVGTANPGPGLSMSAGAVAGDTIQVRINVVGIANFFGAAFEVRYDPASVSFVSSSGAGAFISGAGIQTRFQAVQLAPGRLDVNATRQGQIAGVTAAGTQLLITLTFRATTETAANAFTFGPAAEREVQACSNATTCAPVADGTLNWTGGTLTVVRN